MPNPQRKNSKSNTQAGNDFETLVAKLLSKKFPNLTNNYIVDIGIKSKKPHSFDLGSNNPKVIIECKSHTWTEGDKVPSAKLTSWDQAMFYFYLAPSKFKKIFVVKKDMSIKRDETLCNYYLRTHYNFIPKNVEFWELDEARKKIKKFYNTNLN